MESVIRITVEPFFNNIMKKLNELDNKIINMDTKIIKIEKELSSHS